MLILSSNRHARRAGRDDPAMLINVSVELGLKGLDPRFMVAQAHPWDRQASRADRSPSFGN